MPEGSRIAQVICGKGVGMNFWHIWSAVKVKNANHAVKDFSTQPDLDAISVEFIQHVFKPDVTICRCQAATDL